MILDSSAFIAILSGEPEAPEFLARIQAAGEVAVAAPTVCEVVTVLTSRLRQPALPYVEDFLRHFGVEVIPFAPRHFAWFQHAFFAYGKGRHPAALNFGDCIAYAVARESGRPLMWKGNDFSLTGIPRA